MKENNKIENLLALVLLNQMKDSTMAKKAKQLNLAGFTNVEIADFLETTSAVVSQQLYSQRKNKKK